MKVQITTTETLTNGKQISFCSPANSSDVSTFLINEEEYDIVDASGKSVLGTINAWSVDSIISVVLNTDTHKAYIQNQNLPIKQYCKLEELGLNRYNNTTYEVCEALNSCPYSQCELSMYLHSSSEISDAPSSKGFLQINVNGHCQDLTFVGENSDGVSCQWKAYYVVRGPGNRVLSSWVTVYTDSNKPTPADIGAIAVSDKPSGSYTGDNGATGPSRQIYVGGTGNVLMITRGLGGGVGFCTETGTLYIGYSDTESSNGNLVIEHEPNMTYHPSTGNFIIKHGTTLLNKTRLTYYYQVL